MRIIAGHSRGRRLQVPPGRLARPTSDRLREALFSILTARVDLVGMRILDLYAGSGALALEAISRGATHATLIEHHVSCCRAITANIAHVGAQDRCTLLQCDVLDGLNRLRKKRACYNLVFVDPPYVVGPWSTLDALSDGRLLSGNEALVIVEHAKKASESAPDKRGNLKKVLGRCYGNSAVTLYALDNATPSDVAPP